MTETCGKRATWVIYNIGDIVSNFSCDEHLAKMVTGPTVNMRRAGASLVCEHVASPKPTTIGTDTTVQEGPHGISIFQGSLTGPVDTIALDWNMAITLRNYIIRSHPNTIFPDPPPEQIVPTPEQLVMSSLREEIEAFKERNRHLKFTGADYRNGMQFTCDVILEFIERVESK